MVVSVNVEKKQEVFASNWQYLSFQMGAAEIKEKNN